MRSYRLKNSIDKKTLQRRLKKAFLSNSERIIAEDFQGFPPTDLTENTFTWAWEGGINSVPPDGWDEYHLLLTAPIQLSLIQNIPLFKSVVVCPQKFSEGKHWIHALKNYFLNHPMENVFFQFEPWTIDRPHNLTAAEVAQFLYMLKFNFPMLSPDLRPGLERVDFRIPDDFELEALDVAEQIRGIQNSSPEISIIIPTYNNKYFLHAALFHLGQQSVNHSRYEIIIVDDGGNDATWDYLEKFGLPENTQIRYLYWPRPKARTRGDSFFRAGLCRNLGVRHARAETLVFVDSDIVVPSNFVQTIIDEMKSADVLQFPRMHIKQEKSSGHVRLENIKTSDLYIEEASYWGPFFETKNWMSLKFFWKYTCTYGLAIKKHTFFEVGGFNRTYVSYGFEDTELGYRMAKNKKIFKLARLNLYHLTAYSSSEYQSSRLKRRRLLGKTAKQFFLNTLDLEVYQNLRGFMGGENAIYYRIKKALGSLSKNKSSDEKLLTHP